MFGLETTVQVYFVPVGIRSPFSPSVSVKLKVSPEQMSNSFAVITGVGLTVMVTVNVLPTQLPVSPEVGVTV